MKPQPVIFCVEDENGTEALGKALAEILPVRSVVSLIGTLGAGKTRLVQSVAEALGEEAGTVASPTFVLVKEYRGGRIPVFHFDTYRLRDEDEFLELGPEEYFDADGLSFVEWGDRMEDVLPEDRLEIKITVLDVSKRQFEIQVRGDYPTDILEKLRTALA